MENDCRRVLVGAVRQRRLEEEGVDAFVGGDDGGTRDRGAHRGGIDGHDEEPASLRAPGLRQSADRVGSGAAARYTDIGAAPTPQRLRDPVVEEVLRVAFDHDHHRTVAEVGARLVDHRGVAALLGHGAHLDDGGDRIHDRGDGQGDRAHRSRHTCGPEPTVRIRTNPRHGHGEPEREQYQHRKRAEEETPRDPQVIGHRVGFVEVQESSGHEHRERADRRAASDRGAAP